MKSTTFNRTKIIHQIVNLFLITLIILFALTNINSSANASTYLSNQVKNESTNLKYIARILESKTFNRTNALSTKTDANTKQYLETNTEQQKTIVNENTLENGPLFIENVGQFDPEVKFLMMSEDLTIWFTESAIWFTKVEPMTEATNQEITPTITVTPTPSPEDTTNNNDFLNRNSVNIKLQFNAINIGTTMEGFEESNSVISYFYGDDPTKWKSNVPVWHGIRYISIYDGIDLEITSVNGTWNWIFNIIDSTSTHEEIFSLLFTGQDGLFLVGDTIHLTTQVGDILLPRISGKFQQNPISTFYQYGTSENQIEITLDNGYELHEDQSSEDINYQNRTQAASNDANSLKYSTFLGGTGQEAGFGISIDENGNAYVVGQTYSPDFPHTTGEYHGGDTDMFVTKLASNGSIAYFSSFIGGNDIDCYQDCKIQVGEAGESFIVGTTKSSDFPVPLGYDSELNGSTDAFVIRLGQNGTSLNYGTYLGGNGNEFAHGIDIDDGYIYITGMTDSDNFPVRNAFQYNDQPYQDVFVSKFDLSLSYDDSLVYSTYIGGNSSDQGHDIDVFNGYAYITGQTLSTNFSTPNAFDTSHNGDWDSFALKLNPQGNALVYSTYLGGSGQDCEISGDGKECAIEVDPDGYVYLTGITLSSNFPTYQALDSTINEVDAYVTKLNQNGNGLVYSTFLGGTSGDYSRALSIDEMGYAYIVGITYSSDFPITYQAFDFSLEIADVFITVFAPSGQSITYSSFFGGISEDLGFDLDILNSNRTGIYITGKTYSYTDFPLKNAYDAIYSDTEAFAAELIINSNAIPISSIRSSCETKNGETECPGITTYNNAQGFTGDPINTRTGGFDYSVIDLSFPTLSGELNFHRYYSSLSTDVFTNTLGFGWTYNLDTYLLFPTDPFGEEGKIIYKANSGNFITFYNNEDGTFTTDPGVLIELSKIISPTIQYRIKDTDQNVYFFNETGKIIQFSDPQGHYLIYSYMGGQLNQITDDSGDRYMQFEYLPTGQLYSVTDFTDRVVEFGYDGIGNLVVMTDTLNQPWVYLYQDPTNAHFLTDILDPDGQSVVRTTYYSDGRVQRQENGEEEEIVSLRYNLDGTTIITNGLEISSSHIYDGRNTLILQDNPLNSFSSTSYDYNFRPLTMTDSSGTSFFKWSEDGRNLLGFIDALDGSIAMEYDDLNNLIAITDTLTNTTYNSYDGTLLRSVTNWVDGLSQTTIYTYTGESDIGQPVGLLKAVEDPEGNQTSYTYNEYGELITTTDALGQTTNYDYDLLGRLITVTHPDTRKDWTCYDAAGRVIKTVTNASGLDPCEPAYTPIGNSTQDIIHETVYDDAGKFIATKEWIYYDSSYHQIITRTYYDDANRVTSIVYNLDPNYGIETENPPTPSITTLDREFNYNQRTDTKYDMAGNPIATIQWVMYDSDPITVTTRTYYDLLGRPTDVVQNWVGVDLYSNDIPLYDSDYPDQNVRTHTDYDAAGNVVQTLTNDGMITYTCYDELNRPIKSIVNPTSSTPCNSYTPSTDADKDITTETVYDAAGNTIATIDPLGIVTRTYYDSLYRPVTTVTNLGGYPIDNDIPPTPSLESGPELYARTDTFYDRNGNTIATRTWNVTETEVTTVVDLTFYDALKRPYLTVSNVEDAWNPWLHDPLPEGTPTCNRDTTGTIEPTNICSETVYDDYGNAIASIDALGRITRTYYDILGRPISVVRNLVGYDLEEDEVPPYLSSYPADENVRTDTVYDFNGRAIAHTAFYTHDGITDTVATRQFFDFLGRQVAVIQNFQGDLNDDDYSTYCLPDNGTNLCTKTVYDYQGTAIATERVLSTNDSVITHQFFDDLGRTTSVVENWQDSSLYSNDPPEYSAQTPDLNIRVDTKYGSSQRPIATIEWLAEGETEVTRITRTYYNRAGETDASVQNLTSQDYTIDDPPVSHTGENDENIITRYKYDKTGQRISITNPLLVDTRFGYDGLSRLVEVIENFQDSVTPTYTVNVTTEYGYDLLGNRLSIWDANAVLEDRDDQTLFTYDALNRLTSESDPLGNTTTYSYDAAGNQVKMTDAETVETIYTYDDLNRLLKTEYEDPATPTEYQYNALGWRTVMTDSVGVTTWDYNLSGWVVAVTDPFTGTVEYGYNALGWRTSLTYPDQKLVAYTFDDLGRLKTVTDWNLDQTQFTYSMKGNVVKIEYPNGVTTTYQYDRLDRVTSISSNTKYGTISSFEYAYDLLGNRSFVTEAVGAPGAYDLIFADGFESGNFSHWSSYTNNADLTVSSQAALRGDYGMKIVVNDNGSLYVTDNTPSAETHYRARFYFKPNLTTMSMADYHDILIGYSNSMIQPVVFRVEFGRPVSSGTYSLRLGVCLDSGSTWTYSSWTTISSSAHRIEVEWQKATAAGSNNGYYRLWLDEDPDASPLIQLTGLDTDLERVESVRLGAVSGIDTNTRGTYYFDAFESRKDTPIGAEPVEMDVLQDGMQEEYYEEYDVAFDETLILTGTETITAELVIYPLEDPFFVFDEAGELSSIEEPTLGLMVAEPNITIVYVYDPLSRLTEANYSDGRYLHYTYDSNGNRLIEISCLESRCTPVTTNYEYDVANRLTKMGTTDFTWSDSGNLLSDGVHTYSYDSLNRLTGTSGGGMTATAYVYNGRGDRIEQWADLQRTRYTLDLALGLPQVLSDGTTSYLYGNARLAQQSGGEMEFFLADALGSVRQLANDTSIILTKEYEPYGEVLSEEGSGASYYGYGGEWTSPYNEFVYLRARWYAVEQGRFLTSDTWGGSQTEPMSYNGWLYTYANPVNNIDPSGKFPISDDECGSPCEKTHFPWIPSSFPMGDEVESAYTNLSKVAWECIDNGAVVTHLNPWWKTELARSKKPSRVDATLAVSVMVYMEYYKIPSDARNAVSEALSRRYWSGKMGTVPPGGSIDAEGHIDDGLHWLLDWSASFGSLANGINPAGSPYQKYYGDPSIIAYPYARMILNPTQYSWKRFDPNPPVNGNCTNSSTTWCRPWDAYNASGQDLDHFKQDWRSQKEVSSVNEDGVFYLWDSYVILTYGQFKWHLDK